MDFEELKKYLRVDGNEEDVMIGMLVKAAEKYVTNATGYVFGSIRDELVDMAVTILVTRWYENREMMGQGNMQDIGLTSILTQIGICKGGGTA